LTGYNCVGKIGLYMAYLKRVRIGEGTYYYICHSRRLKRVDKVKQITLEYLGRDPSKARLDAALKKWGVKKRRR